jgi:uncharacterized protein DUF5670
MSNLAIERSRAKWESQVVANVSCGSRILRKRANFSTRCSKKAWRVDEHLDNRQQNLTQQKGIPVLWTIIVILVVLWLLGFIGHFGGALIHLLLVIAVIVLVIQLIQGRRL